MAKASISKPKTKKTVRAARRINGFALMPTNDFWKAKHFVHYEIESKDWATAIQTYINKSLDKASIAAIGNVPEWKLSYASHWATVAYWLTNNLNPPENYVIAFKKYLETLVTEGKRLAEIKKEQAKAKQLNNQPSIQDRIREQAAQACESIEQWLDSFVKDKKSFDPAAFDFKTHFSKYNISQAHARKIVKFYEGELEEMRLVVARPTAAQLAKIKDPKAKDNTEQLVEAYKHLTKSQAQLYLQALENLINSCNFLIDTSRATRKPRIPKAPSKEKLVSKIKYKVSDDRFQVASINPVEVVGCEELWVFNTRTRKLGKYVAADDAGTMTIKGTTIVGYDPNKSIQKTLKKPTETLKEFREAGKVKLRKFIDQIVTTETKLSGRINQDTILLKAVAK